MTPVRKRRLVVGSGRRKRDSSSSSAKSYGSSTSTKSNSAPRGMGRPTRISALLRSMLYAALRAATDETSASGEFDPSLVRKIGSAPPVASNRFWTSVGLIVQPAAATWQEAQDRPFVPRL